MRKPRTLLIRLVSVLVASLVLPSLAFAWASGASDAPLRLAYIDPGTGSFVAQAVVAAIAGVAVTVRLYWSKIKQMLGFASTHDDDEDIDVDDV